MYMIVIWVGLLLLSPDNWPEYVNERIGIPHVWHVFVFALAFSLAINVHRLSAIASARYKRFKLRKRIKMQNDKVRSVIQNLTEEQSMVLCAALNEGRKYVVTSKQFPYISELIELGVLNKTFSRWNGKHILFPIEDIY
ncbi:superinfection exclusion B family protein, partial [Raoultella ornithinolytica]